MFYCVHEHVDLPHPFDLWQTRRPNTFILRNGGSGVVYKIQRMKLFFLLITFCKKGKLRLFEVCFDIVAKEAGSVWPHRTVSTGC